MINPAYYSAEWKGFITKLRENFDDEHTKLVAADWLQENGEEDRAELIRRCIEFNNECKMNLSKAMWRGRPVVYVPPDVADLRVKLASTYLRPLLKCEERRSCPYMYEYEGLLNRINCTKDDWPVISEELYILEPVKRVGLVVDDHVDPMELPSPSLWPDIEFYLDPL